MIRIIFYLFISIALLLIVSVVDLSRNQRGHFESRHGDLSSVGINNQVVTQLGTFFQDVDLGSTSGLQIEMRVQLPVEAESGKVPLILLLGGHETGKYAVDLVKNPSGVAFAAINYPYKGTLFPDTILDKATMLLDIQAAFIDTPPALMLAMDWLERQSWYDQNRTNLLGVSLGVPFATAAAAMDNRFKRVWLIHGAVKNAEWLNHELSEHIKTDWIRAAIAHLLVFLMYGNSFDTINLIDDIAPRPIVLISAKEDERVPEQSIKILLNAEKSDHVTHQWTDGRHIGPRRKRELNQLLEIVLDGVLADANF